jgi:hypothetical protein
MPDASICSQQLARVGPLSKGSRDQRASTFEDLSGACPTVWPITIAAEMFDFLFSI